MSKLIFLAVVGTTGFIFLQVLVFWLTAKAKEVEKQRYQERRKQAKLEENAAKKDLEQKVDINYDAIIANNKKPKIYSDALELFNTSMRSKSLSREQILYLKKILNQCIPREHRDLYKIAYKNDAHEIYCKLKSSFIDETTYRRIMEYLTMIQEN